MVMSGKKKHPIVKPEGAKAKRPPVQMRIDHLFLAMTSPIRISIMKFLTRARKNGTPLQSFTNIQHAIESIDTFTSTANLGYHLAELKKVQFVDHLDEDGKGPAYMITELGRKLVEIYFSLESVHEEFNILHPNDMEIHVYRDDMLKMLEPCTDFPHVTSIKFSPLVQEKDVDQFLLEHMADLPKPKKKGPHRKPASDELESFDRFF